tara:strand:+ start:61 stop:972 length:912 start_codon:yes stop_codon:yes gene_type:complete
LKNKNSILIVGGTGFIGYHLAKKSLKKGWKVTSISTKRPKKIRYLKRVKYILCDISKKNFLKKKIRENFNYVVNLGGYVDHSNRKKTLGSHYKGCKNLTEFFLKKKPRAFIQMGSSGEYGTLRSPQKENSKCNPQSIYGQAKLLSSKYLINIFKKKNFPVTILRLYQAYGPKQDFNRLIPIVIKACKNNKKFPCSSGEQLRDFLYVEDVVDAILNSLKSEKARGQIINVGTGKPKKVKDVINLIKNILKGGYPQFGKIKFRKDEILKIYPNIKKAKEKINWYPRTSFNKGLKLTIKYYNEQSI